VRRNEPVAASLAFVTVWALFGIELIGGHAKDVVALDANAVDEDLGVLASECRGFWLASRGRLRGIAHGHILARQSRRQEPHP
jgi:hypothetical protein